MKHCLAYVSFVVVLCVFAGLVNAEELKTNPGDITPDFKAAGMKILFFISVVATIALLINRSKNKFFNAEVANSKIEVIEERILQGTTKISLLSISKKQFLLTTTNTGGIAVYPLGIDDEGVIEKVNKLQSERNLINV